MKLGAEDWIKVLAGTHEEYPEGASDEMRAHAEKELREHLRQLTVEKGKLRTLARVLRKLGVQIGATKVEIRGREQIEAIWTVCGEPEHDKRREW